MEKYKRMAFELVSVSRTDYERMKTENAHVLAMAAEDKNTKFGTMLPSFTAFKDCIDERLNLWRRIIRCYARTYEQNPLLNKWCLLGSVAGETAMFPGARNAVATLRKSGTLLPVELCRALQSWVTCFLLTNFAIYEDIYSAHLAFHAGDTDAMGELPGYFQQLLPLWIRAKDEHHECISVDANRLLVDREQVEVCTPIFLKFPDGMKFITATGKMEWPRLFKKYALKADMDPQWPDIAISYAPAEPRTSWLRRGCDAYLRWVAKSDNGVERYLKSLNASKL